MSRLSLGPKGMGYRANCRCKGDNCHQALAVYPEDAVVHFVDSEGRVHVFYIGAEEAEALAKDLHELARKKPSVD